MSKRDEFIAFIDDLKSVSATITEEQRKGLLRRAVQQHDLSAADAVDILKTSGLVIGEKENYFEVLGISIEELQNFSEDAIAAQVEAAHKKLYTASLRAGGRPRVDGKTEEQWRALLNQACDALKDGQKRQAHIAMLQNDVLPPIESFSEKHLLIRRLRLFHQGHLNKIVWRLSLLVISKWEATIMMPTLTKNPHIQST